MKNSGFHFREIIFQKKIAFLKISLLVTVLPFLASLSTSEDGITHNDNTTTLTKMPGFLTCPIDSVTTKIYSRSDCNDNGTDDYSDDFVTIDVVVHFNGDSIPQTGDLEITGPRIIGNWTVGIDTLIGLDSFIFDDVPFRSDSLNHTNFVITATFTDAPSCSLTNTNAGYWWPPGPFIPDTSFRVRILRQCSVCIPPDGFAVSTNPIPDCWPTENPDSISSPCEDFTNYGPDPDFPENTPIKYIKVVLHIFQQEAPLPPENYDTSHMDIIRSWFTHPNGTNAQWSTGLCEDPNITPVMTDARLRVVNTGTEGYDVFFHQNNSGWNGSYPKDDYVTNPDSNIVGSDYYWALKDPDILNAHHVFIAYKWGSYTLGGYSSGFCDTNSPTSVIYGNYPAMLNIVDPSESELAAFGQQMLGEIYHLLSVDHTSPLQAHYVHDDLPGSGDGCYDTPMFIDGQTLTGCQISTRCAFSQCQIGRMHRFIEKNNPGFERFLVGYDSIGSPIFSRTERNCNLVDPDIIIPDSADILWAGPKSLRSNVIVETGGKLTITCDIGMPEGGKFIVEPGAYLIIDGAKIYNNCDGAFWHGIEISGTPSQSQFPPISNGQGYLRMLSGSSLERAEFPIYAKGGGLVRATSSDFINCGEVRIADYKLLNISLFSGCNFTRDSTFDLGYWPDQVELNSVNRVSFSNCNFKTSYGEGVPNGAAILGFGSTFNVGTSTFEGYRIGVWGYAWFDHQVGTFSIRKSTFRDNRVSIASWGCDNITIQDNTISGIGNHPESGKQRGLTLWNCTGYTVTDNAFKGINSGDSDLVGIWARNTGSEYNEIKRNSFDSLYVANQAEENNSGNFMGDGLQYLCNSNLTENTYDFFAMDQGIAVHQGGDQNATGNTFTHFNDILGDFNNMGPNLLRYYHLSSYSHTPQDGYYINIEPKEVSDYGANCSAGTDIPHPDTLDGYGAPPMDSLVLSTSEETDITVLYDDAKASKDSLFTVYLTLLNGSVNENTLASEITTASSSQADSLIQALLGHSPYLTRKVLEAVAIRDDLFENADIDTILSANPDELGASGFQEFLYGELDSALVDSILIHQGQFTERTTMEASLTGYKMDMFRAAKRIIISDLADTTGLDTAKYRLWLSKKGSLESAYHKVGTYIMEGDFVKARQFRDSIPTLFGLTDSNLSEHGLYEDLTDIVIGAMQGNVHYAAYDSVRVVQVRTVADSSSGVAGTMAKGLLNVFYGYSYWSDPASPPDPPLHIMAPPSNGRAPQMGKGKAYGLSLEAVPNPARGTVTFYFDLGREGAVAMLGVYGVDGQLIKSMDLRGRKGSVTWDTTFAPRGIYYCRMDLGVGYLEPLKLLLTN